MQFFVETKFFEFEYFFSFQFCQNVQFSFNFESSVKLSFPQNSRIEFSLSCLTWCNFSSRLSFHFTLISWEASCLFEILIDCSRSEWQNLSVGYSFLLFILVSEFVLMGPIVVLDKKLDVAFWYSIVWDYFSLFYSGRTWSVWFFSQK